MTALLTFLFRTKLGNAIGIALIVLACWYGFSRHYVQVGVTHCQNEQAKKVAEANVKLIEEERKRDSTSSTVATETREKTEEVKQTINDSSTKKKEVIRDAYRDEKPKPTTLGSCAYHVPERVQRSISAAVDQANSATR